MLKLFVNIYGFHELPHFYKGKYMSFGNIVQNVT